MVIVHRSLETCQKNGTFGNLFLSALGRSLDVFPPALFYHPRLVSDCDVNSTIHSTTFCNCSFSVIFSLGLSSFLLISRDWRLLRSNFDGLLDLHFEWPLWQCLQRSSLAVPNSDYDGEHVIIVGISFSILSWSIWSVHALWRCMYSKGHLLLILSFRRLTNSASGLIRVSFSIIHFARGLFKFFVSGSLSTLPTRNESKNGLLHNIIERFLDSGKYQRFDVFRRYVHLTWSTSDTVFLIVHLITICHPSGRYFSRLGGRSGKHVTLPAQPLQRSSYLFVMFLKVS